MYTYICFVIIYFYLLVWPLTLQSTKQAPTDTYSYFITRCYIFYLILNTYIISCTHWVSVLLSYVQWSSAVNKFWVYPNMLNKILKTFSFSYKKIPRFDRNIASKCVILYLTLWPGYKMSREFSHGGEIHRFVCCFVIG